MHSTPSKEVKMLALEYYNKNPELFKQNEVKGEELLKAMMERVYMPDKPIKTEKK